MVKLNCLADEQGSLFVCSLISVKLILFFSLLLSSKAKQMRLGQTGGTTTSLNSETLL